MAKVIEGFDAGEFRAGIRSAMLVALPDDRARWPRFVFTTKPEGDDVDPVGVPWTLDQAMADPEDRGVRVLCAIEMSERSEQTRRFGSLQPGQIEVTLLDEEYAQVEGFKYVEVWTSRAGAPVRYYYRRILLHTNLDSVGVWVLDCATEDTV